MNNEEYIESIRALAKPYDLRNNKAESCSRPVTLLSAAKQMLSVIVGECREKGQMCPITEDYSPDYHVEITLTVCEIEAFYAAVREADNAELRDRSGSGGPQP